MISVSVVFSSSDGKLALLQKRPNLLLNEGLNPGRLKASIIQKNLLSVATPCLRTAERNSEKVDTPSNVF
jgi:hypothetical protein